MGRRILAFFLGFLLGIIFVFAALAGAIYVAITVVHPSDIYPNSDKLLGDLAGMSLLDIYQSITDLYSQKVGIRDENGQYFTLEQFCQHYHINPNELFGGKEVPQEVLELPIFEMFGGDNSGAMEQVKVSAILAFVNMFTAGEDGVGLFSQDLIEKMSTHSVAEFTDADKGIAYIFGEVLISDVLPSVFPKEKSDDNAIMWALGQSSIGKLLNGMGGNILLQFKQDGAFEAMGSLKFKELLGDGSAILNAVFKNHTLSDLIDDNGGINPDDMLNSLYLGDLLGLQRNELNVDVGDYLEIYTSQDGKTAVLSAIDGIDKYVIRLSAVGEVEYEYYEARLSCTFKEHTHSEKCGEPSESGDYSCAQKEHLHDVNCFASVWYLQTPSTTDSDDDMIKNGVHYNRATGLYTAIADVTVGELMSGSTDTLIDKLMDVQIGDVLAGQEVPEAFDGFKNMTIRQLITEGIDNIYFGTVFGFVRKEYTSIDDFTYLGDDLMTNNNGEVIRKDGDKWYLAEPHCVDESHEHVASCYKFVWFRNADYTTRCEGVKGALANTTIGELNDLNATILDLTLIDLFGEESLPSILQGLGHTRIGDLAKEIDKMCLGDFLGYVRKPLTAVEGNIQELTNDNGDTVYYLIKNGDTIALSKDQTAWYEGKLICVTEGHAHKAKCYAFVWYVSDNYAKTVEGMMGKLASETISDLGNISDTIMTFTLSDVMGDKLPSMFNSIKDKQIGELDGAINQMYLGDFLSYHRDQLEDDGYVDSGIEGVLKHASSDEYIRKDDDGNWYAAKYGCKIGDDHSHDATCYVFVWYSCNPTEGHVHNDTCIATGMMGKLANEKISNLGKLNETIKSFTLRDVMGDDVPDMLKSIQDTSIGNLNNALNSMYLGEILGYNRITPDDIDNYNDTIDGIRQRELDGITLYVKMDKDDIWYNAKLDCYVEAHTEQSHHDESCYKYIWYTVSEGKDGSTYTEETGVLAKFANLTVGGMKSDTIQDVINNTTLGELLPDISSNKMLAELADVKIIHLSSEINSVYVGTAMGYFREETTVNVDGLPSVVDNVRYDGNTGSYYIFDTHKNKWYDGKLNCLKQINEGHTKHEDGCFNTEKGDYDCGYHVHDASCYGYIWYNCQHKSDETHEDSCAVHGLNGKMSSLTLEDLSGNKLGTVLQNLTVGDIIDSGMMSEPSENNLYVYAIIFCSHEYCDLTHYFLSQKSTKDYWLNAHGYTNNTDEAVYKAHRDEWRDKPLSEFMNTMLDTISSISFSMSDFAGM